MKAKARSFEACWGGKWRFHGHRRRGVGLLERQGRHAEVERPSGGARTGLELDVRCVGCARQRRAGGRGPTPRVERGPRNGLGGRVHHGTIGRATHGHLDAFRRPSKCRRCRIHTHGSVCAARLHDGTAVCVESQKKVPDSWTKLAGVPRSDDAQTSSGHVLVGGTAVGAGHADRAVAQALDCRAEGEANRAG